MYFDVLSLSFFFLSFFPCQIALLLILILYYHCSSDIRSEEVELTGESAGELAER